MMGWSAYITARSDIDASDVHNCLKEMNDGQAPNRQDWGWSDVCDVNLPKGKELCVSGSWNSFAEADEFTRELARCLRSRGYSTNITKPS